MDLSFSDIMAQLGPYSQPGLMFNIQLYILFFLNLVAFFMQSEKQLEATLMCTAVLAFLIIAKLNLLDPQNIFLLIINIGIFVLPMILTGMSKAKKSQPITGLAALLGLGYFFSFWWFQQQ